VAVGRDKLGNAKPVILNLDNGIRVHQIAGLKPDLIVATDAGVDEDTYQKLPRRGDSAVRRLRILRAVEERTTAIGRAVFSQTR
jgi:iron complex transport system substrate-binding protein